MFRFELRTQRVIAPLLVALALPACETLSDQRADAPAPTYPVIVLTRRDARQPLAGVKIFQGKKLLGTSDDAGKIQTTLSGQEGTAAELTVKCPETFASPERPIIVGLRQMAQGSPAPKFETECIPLVRTVLVGLRADNGPNLPVIRLNRVVGHTDEFGVAHVVLQGAPGEQVTLTVSTVTNPSLKPPNPSLTFVVSDRDEMVLLEQKFTVHKAVIRARPKNVPRPL